MNSQQRGYRLVCTALFGMFVLLLFTSHFALKLGNDSRASKGDTRPAHGRQRVSLEENGQEDRKDLARRGDCGQHQWIKVGNGIKDLERKTQERGKG